MPDAPEKKRPFDTYPMRVEKTTLISPRIRHIVFKFKDGKNMPFTAGQFVQMVIPQPDKPRRTSYSIASPPLHPDFFELCVTLVDGGKSSTYLHNLREGDEIQAIGPFGKFVLPQPLLRDITFIATGSGIAPFRSMINDLLHKGAPRNLSLLFGNRFPEDIIYDDEWKALAQKHGDKLRVLHTLSRPPASWPGEKGYVQDKIEGFVKDAAARDFYICGLVKMIEGVVEKLKSLGVTEDHIHFERYD